MPPIQHSGIQIDRDRRYKEKDKFEEGLAQVDPFGYLMKSSFILKKRYKPNCITRFMYRINILHGIVIQLVHIQHILKGGAKRVHDVVLFVERRDPFANVVHLDVGRNAVLGKGDELMVIVLLHVVIRHLVLAEIQANHEKRAFWIGMRLIDKHGGCD